MSRHKVPDDKRQRTAQACDYCKRRKQKCTGGQPCSTCSKKSVSCTYVASSSSKRYSEHTSSVSPSKRYRAASCSLPHAQAEEKQRTYGRRKKGISIELETSFLEYPAPAPVQSPAPARSMDAPEVSDYSRQQYNASDAVFEDHPHTSAASGQDEEDTLVHTMRLLKDRTGRFLYIGDSATLAYLHLFRRIVESISGQSPFTTDVHKENIVESCVELPSHLQLPTMIAHRTTADILVESFFTNTSGLVEVFDRRDFHADLDACYDNPLCTSNQSLCLLFLTFAIGLVMATPPPGTAEAAIVDRLRDQPLDQAEIFFRSAKCLGNPLNGLEDGDFWSVQALTLMSIYMLAVSKRNAAFAYHGMAVRSAIALGLHSEEAMAKFKDSQLQARCNLWKSLYVLDRFISALLGRPSAINEEECTEAALGDPLLPQVSSAAEHGGAAGAGTGTGIETHVLGFNAAVRSSRIIGDILKKVYARRRVSARTTQEITQHCRDWVMHLHECLRWQQQQQQHQRQNRQLPRAQSIAILHANLLFCHAVILLARPFFLFLVQADCSRLKRATPQLPSRTVDLSQLCIKASYHTVTMIHSALKSKCLPRRNPFVMYFLFTAVLLIMSNEFVVLFENPSYDKHFCQAIDAMEHFAIADPQGKRLLWILRALQDVVVKQAAKDTHADGFAIRRFRYPYHQGSLGHSTVDDPMERYFAPHASAGPDTKKDADADASVGTSRRSIGIDMASCSNASGGGLGGSILGGLSDTTSSSSRQWECSGGGGGTGNNRRCSLITAATRPSGLPSDLPPGFPSGQLGTNDLLAQASAGFSQSHNVIPLSYQVSVAMPSATMTTAAISTGTTVATSGSDRGSARRPYSSSPEASSFGKPAFQATVATCEMSQSHTVLPPPFLFPGPQHPSQHATAFHVDAGSGLEMYRAQTGSKQTGPDSSDSIETEGEGFELGSLWDWPSTALHLSDVTDVAVATDATAGTTTDSLTMSNVSDIGDTPFMEGVPGRETEENARGVYPGVVQDSVSQFSVGERAGEGGRGKGGRKSMLVGTETAPGAASPATPIYPPYGMTLTDGGGGMGRQS